jgi:TRAP-type C4-dicarboxylate transport system permease small subunit
MLNRIDNFIGTMERVLSVTAAVMLLLIMLLVAVDVALRYFVRAPLGWSYDLISHYLMVGLFFFSLSTTLQHEEHVRVDVLLKHFPVPMRHFAELVTYAFASVVFALIVYITFTKALQSFQANEVSPGLVPWPAWLSIALVPIGCGVLLLRMVFRFIGHAISLASNRSRIPLPALTGSEEAI